MRTNLSLVGSDISAVSMAINNDLKALRDEYRVAQDYFDVEHMQRLHEMIASASAVARKIEEYYGA